MRILLLSFEYPPDTGFGGIGTYTWYQARALAALGHDVHVLAGATAATPLTTSEHDGVTVFRYRSTGVAMGLFRSLGRFRLWWTRNRLENAFSMSRGMSLLRRRYQYDVVEMPECGGEGMLINHRAAARTVVRLHSPARLIMPYYDVRRADMALCGFVEQRGIRGAGALTSCSRFLAEEARARLGVRRPIRVIPNGIDLALFDGQEQMDLRNRYALPRDRPIVFFAGRMERRKGVHLLRDIAAAILERHEVTLVLAGEDLFGVVENDLLPFLATRRLRGSVHYLGKLDLAAMRSGVRQCDVFLLPSEWENCPYTCLEAMAAGRAIVSSDQGGLPELITDGSNGLLAANGDVTSYVAALDRLFGDPALRERLGAAARRTIEGSFRDVEIARRSVAYYEEFLGGAA